MAENENTISKPPASQRRMMAIVVILGVLIVLAFGALVGGFVLKLMGAGGKGAGPYVSDVAITPGTAVIGTELNDGKVALKLNTPTGEEIVIVDAATGRELGRVRLKPKP